MSTYQWEPYLREILSVIKPLEEDRATRVRIIDELQAVVDTVGNLRGATVEPFGSFISNLYTRWGDLDISLELPNGSFVSSAGKRRKQNLLKDLRVALQRNGGAHNLQFIPKARVPLLIFESNHRNISCDISISNLLGQIKSKFLFWITEIDDRFRDMVLLVKEWAKAQNINNPKSGTLNSYSLCLLVIFHFQTCEPAILPPLQEIYAGNISDDLTVCTMQTFSVRVNVERDIQATCAGNITRFRSNRLRRVNRSSLSELFASFFKKIEDPFEQSQNAARAVGTSQLIMISNALEGSHNRLRLANQDRNSLIASLVRPQIRSQLGVWRPPSYLGGVQLGSRTHASAVPSPIQQQFQITRPSPIQHRFQNVQPSASPIQQQFQITRPSPIQQRFQNVQPSASPIQQQFQNMRLGTHPSTSSPRVLDFHSQDRQARRPKPFDQ
ncbi:hypothetical protein HHK36_016337 [Tetracentron sinense]|uniref:Poly(A) RNA polymerase mitochondrial-like central palm domain-containing protein n=1 Tax=Tetracentron sinense TaxID=13715 RepID=A0A834Z2K5_TETSI|nr:hypothetical protein HHK36_016337 [Tetracentron sinense]